MEQTELGLDVSTASGRKRERKQDLAFEALAELDGGYRNLSHQGLGRVRAALKSIRHVAPQVTPHDIQTRAARFHRLFPGATITSTAVSTHWARLGIDTQSAQMNVVRHDPEKPVVTDCRAALSAARKGLRINGVATP